MLIRFCFLSFLLLTAFAQPSLVKTKMADGLSASIPKDWKPMDNIDFIERYPSVRAPIAAYTNQERMTDFSVNISATMWPDANLELAQRFFKASLTNMFDRVEYISEGVRAVNGKKFIFFEFTSRINGSRGQEAPKEPILKYSHIQYYIAKDKTLVFSFNSPSREIQQWQPVAGAIMKSIKVK